MMQLVTIGDAGFRSDLLHHRVERGLLGNPDAVAVQDQYGKITRGELNRRSSHLADVLRGLGVGPGKLVAVSMERGIDLIVGLLGILKAGGAYIPIDPLYPRERIAYMVGDAGPSVILLQQSSVDIFSSSSVDKVVVSEGGNVLRTIPPRTLEGIFNRIEPLGNDLAYVIYTSGSTGRPKGVMIEHAAVCNLLHSLTFRLGFRANDTFLSITTVSFDIAALEIFLPLINRGRLIMGGDNIAHLPISLIEMLDRYEVTFMQATPIVWTLMLESGWKGRGGLTALCGGEAMSRKLARQLVPRVGMLWNMYGPTETTIWSCIHRVAAVPEAPGGNIPIGRPIDATKICIMDSSWVQTEPGVVGELCIGGAGVARGYLNRPALTAERFVPFPEDAQQRMYRTGDLCRYVASGEIEYIGRADHQVKLNGFRMELSEIEAQIEAHPGVSRAVVMLREESDLKRQLFAYVVPAASWMTAEDRSFANSESLQQWASVYDSIYASVPHQSTDPNFDSWTSAYTGLPIPDDQMTNWLVSTVTRIKELRPRCVLEIGCGVGLLLRALVSGIDQYRGTDISVVAIARLSRWTESQPYRDKIALRACEASDVDIVGPASVDTVVLNSVVQYFMDAEHLLLVLERAISRVSVPGHLFIGDVRNLDLLELFLSSVLLSKARPGMTVRGFQDLLSESVEQQKELLVSPRLFLQLPQRFPQITRVRVCLKRDRFDNELSKFRYDAILEIGNDGCRVASPVVRTYGGEVTLEGIAGELRATHPVQLRLIGVPNGRLSADNRNRRLLSQSHPDATIDDLTSSVTDAGDAGVDPELFWTLGEQLGYRVDITWNQESRSGDYDVDFVDEAASGVAPGATGAALDEAVDWHKLVNDTRLAGRRQQLRLQIFERLARTLPDYMLPKGILVLRSFPLTPNGKVDRSRLPVVLAGADRREAYHPPRGAVESKLADIWREFLQCGPIGRDDNFFALGGDSIMGVRLMRVIEQRFARRFTGATIFEYQTIKALAALVSGPDSNARQRIPRRPSGADIPLTFSQRCHWNLWGVGKRGGMRTVYSAVRITGRLSIDCLTDAIADLVDRHESLRTNIVARSGVLVQLVRLASATCMQTIAVSGDDEAARSIEVIVNEPIDVSRAPLFLALLMVQSRDRFVLLLSLDHLIADAVSVGLLLRDLWTLYGSRFLKQALPLAPVEAQFPDFAVWQQSTDAVWMEEHVGVWTRRLAGARPLRLFEARRNMQLGMATLARTPILVPDRTCSSLRDIASRECTSLAMVFCSIYVEYLARWSGDTDIVIPFITTGRLCPEVDCTVGCFGSTLYLRISVSPDNTFLDLLKGVTAEYGAASKHDDCGRVDALIPRPAYAKNPSLNWFPKQFELHPTAWTAFVRVQEVEWLRACGIDIEPFTAEVSSSHEFAAGAVSAEDWDNEPTLLVSDNGRVIAGHFIYRADRADAATMKEFATGFLDAVQCTAAQSGLASAQPTRGIICGSARNWVE